MHRTVRLTFVAIVSLLGACAPEGSGVAFVSVNVARDGDCLPDSAADLFLPQGMFDITAAESGCARSYVVNLLVNSFLRANSDGAIGRAEPNVLLLHSAEVKLTTIDDRLLLFEKTDPPLPNPFTVIANNAVFPSVSGEASTAIATVEAIPAAYALGLGEFAGSDQFDGSLIRATIQIFGTTNGGVDIDLAPFVYPIEICKGCLTLRLCDIEAGGMTVDQVLEGKCTIGGVDGRFCIDTSAKCD